MLDSAIMLCLTMTILGSTGAPKRRVACPTPGLVGQAYMILLPRTYSIFLYFNLRTVQGVARPT